MRIEHVAFTVEDPRAAADWYIAHMGMKVVRSGGAPVHARFLVDSEGCTMLEIYNNPKVSVPNYRRMDPLLLHVAFTCQDVEAERDRLLAAGCTLVDDVVTIETGDTMAMLRDPWGVPIQLMKRSRPMA